MVLIKTLYVEDVLGNHETMLAPEEKVMKQHEEGITNPQVAKHAQYALFLTGFSLGLRATIFQKPLQA